MTKPKKVPHQKLKLYFDEKGKMVKAKDHEGQPIKLPEGLGVYRPGDEEGDPPMPCYYIAGSWVCTH